MKVRNVQRRLKKEELAAQKQRLEEAKTCAAQRGIKASHMVTFVTVGKTKSITSPVSQKLFKKLLGLAREEAFSEYQHDRANKPRPYWNTLRPNILF